MLRILGLILLDQQSKQPPRTIKSFVLRQGRLTQSQKQALERLWPKFGIDLADQPLAVESLFENNNKQLVVEIGFGMGHSLVQQAQQETDKNFIGIEVHKPGVGTCLKEVERLNVKNLKLMNADAILVLEQMIPDNSLSRVQLYFPDPWHKKKHNKRRIVNSKFVQRIYTKLTAEGCLHMATDWQPYAVHMLEVMQQAQNYKNLGNKDGFIDAPDFRPVTKFETRGRNLGHGVWDLLYQKIP